MKPMTSGHYKLITEAVADSRAPDGEETASEAYVLISVQDRIKKGELPVSGEAALTAMRDVYLKNTDFMRFNIKKTVNLVFCHSERFAADKAERIAEIRLIVDDIKNVLAANGITNVTTSVEQSQKGGPPSYLVDLANRSPNDTFVLYTGQDDIKKYQPLTEYAPNLELAGFERFTGGISGTEARNLIQKTKEDYEDEAEFTAADERFKQAFPPGVNPDDVRKHYRSSAGLKTESSMENNSLALGTEEYQLHIDEIIEKLLGVKSSLNTRKKTGKYYRKEAAACQTAITSLRHLKRKSERELLKNSNVLNEVYEGRLEVKFKNSEDINRETIRNFLSILKKK
jgi:hypothetical protein